MVILICPAHQQRTAHDFCLCLVGEDVVDDVGAFAELFVAAAAWVYPNEQIETEGEITTCR